MRSIITNFPSSLTLKNKKIRHHTLTRAALPRSDKPRRGREFDSHLRHLQVTAARKVEVICSDLRKSTYLFRMKSTTEKRGTVTLKRLKRLKHLKRLKRTKKRESKREKRALLEFFSFFSVLKLWNLRDLEGASMNSSPCEDKFLRKNIKMYSKNWKISK